MDEDVAKLGLKYKLALKQIRELTDAKDLYQKQLEEQVKKDSVVRTQAKILCEKIMNKENEPDDEEAKRRSKLSLAKMIEEAGIILDEKVNRENAEMKDLIKENKLLRENHSKRTEEIVQLNETIEQMRNEAMDSGNSSSQMDAIADIGTGKAPPAFESETTPKHYKIDPHAQVEVEDDESVMDVVEEASSQIIKGNVRKPLAPTVDVDYGEKLPLDSSVKEKEKTSKLLENTITLACRNKNILTDTARAIIQVIGEQGLSLRKEIFDACLKEFPGIKSSSKLNTALEFLTKRSLANYGFEIVKAENISTPKAPTTGIITLTKEGAAIYRHLFGNEPVKSERQLLCEQHDNPIHGYGIKTFAELMKTMQAFSYESTTVEYMTRRNEYTCNMMIDGKKRRYVPDIVVISQTDSKKKLFYFEFETTKDGPDAIVAKCNKMAHVTRDFNFLVSSDGDKEELIKGLEKWIDDVNEQRKSDHFVFPFNATILVHIMTYNRMQENKGKAYRNWEWSWEKQVHPPSKKKN